MATTPVTPTRKPVPGRVAELLNSTPISAGTASDTSFYEVTTQDHYAPYLAVDVGYTVCMTFNDFLSAAFGLSPKWEELPPISNTATSPKLRDLLDKYTQSLSEKETARYHPFAVAANCVVEELQKYHRPAATGDVVTVCRNDHMPIRGSKAVRIPDCVVVQKRAMSHPDRINVDNLALEGPTQAGFYWSELLSFLEFKRNATNSKLTEASSASPASEPQMEGAKSSTGGRTTNPQRVPRPKRPHAPSSRTTRSSTLGISRVPSEPSSAKRSGSRLDRPSNKKQKVMSDEDFLVQCASYALEMFSYSGLRSHVFGALITDNLLELLYYDRSLLVRSEPINFSLDPSSLVAWLYCLNKSTFSELGHVPILQPPLLPLNKPIHAEHILRGAILKLINGAILELQEILFSQHALIGRGTCVARALVFQAPPGDATWKSKSIIVKFSFIPDTRTPEGQLLSKVIVLAREDPNHSWVLNHLPELLHHESIQPQATDVQYRFAEYFGSEVYEKRSMQILVMTELKPITDLTNTTTLLPAIQDVFKCYKWLYEEAKVIHRDISVNNIMYREVGDKKYGVLTDLDLALLLEVTDKGPTSKHRTGTKPYMAHDLLQDPPPKHRYRHDLESLFYVLVILTTHYHEGSKVDDPPYRAWFELSRQKLADRKNAFMSKIPTLTSHFKDMQVLIVKLQGMLRLGFHAKDNYGPDLFLARMEGRELAEFEEESLGGHFDFAKFEEVLCGDPNHSWVFAPPPLSPLPRNHSPRDYSAQHRFAEHSETTGFTVYEKRLMQILVMEELNPIMDLTSTATLLPAIRDVFNYKQLYQVAKVIHQDISANNIMYRKEGEKIYGVLTDLDLALRLEATTDRSTSNHRTGTKPYMALDLLQPTAPKHLYRHDLESFFYVIVILITHYHEGKKIPNAPYQDWFELGTTSLFDRKNAFLLGSPPKPTTNFNDMEALVIRMMNIFREGFNAQVAYKNKKYLAQKDGEAFTPVFDAETLGGFVDFDIFEEILKDLI